MFHMDHPKIVCTAHASVEDDRARWILSWAPARADCTTDRCQLVDSPQIAASVRDGLQGAPGKLL